MSLLGIDIGTTGCKIIAFNKSAEILSSEYVEYQLIHPNEGWMELDAEYIWIKIKESILKINYRLKKDSIKAFSVSCQGEAIIPADRDGNSLYNAIVTFDSRTYEQYKFWLKNYSKEEIFKITGMPLSPIYSINKIMWIKKNFKDIFKKTYKFLCFEDFIFMKFGLTPTIDYSLASRTMAFDVTKKTWSEKILKEANIPEEYLPDVKLSGEIVGEIAPVIAKECGFKSNVIGVTGGHDQACGAFGSGIVDEGTAMHAAGTSDVLTAVFNHVNLSKEMLKNNYPCYPYVMKDKYMTISFNLTGGLLLKWYRDKFCNEERIMAEKEDKNIYDLIIENANQNPVNIFILPHFVGSGTPYLDPNSKGMILGIDLETDKPKIARAILESNAYDLRLNLEKLEKSGIKIEKIAAIGGGAKLSSWVQLKSDVLGKRFVTLNNKEVASMGAALLAGIAIGEYHSHQDAIDHTVKEIEFFEPDLNNHKIYNDRYLIYSDIYKINSKLLHKIKKLS
jgi:xylulokinase